MLEVIGYDMADHGKSRLMVVESTVVVNPDGKAAVSAFRSATSLGLHVDGRREWRYGENVFYLAPDASPEAVVCMMRFYDGVDKL